MIKLGSSSTYLEIYDRPGTYMCQHELEKLHHEILSVASECLEEIPYYQCLTGSRKEYERLMIAVCRGSDGKLLGFCSSYVLEANGFGNILHLGLTCVHPLARRMGLTHKLTSKVITTYLLRYSLFKTTWISNVACVLSSLGNVALYFEDVYPSPFYSIPSLEHQALAKLIDEKFRWELYINKEATFDAKKFVFEGSVTGTVFAKSDTDIKYHHRNPELTEFYLNRINFSNGDEVLQIGKISLFSFPKYLLKKLFRKLMTLSRLKTSEVVA